MPLLFFALVSFNLFSSARDGVIFFRTLHLSLRFAPSLSPAHCAFAFALFAMLSFAPARAFSSLTAASGAALASLSARGLGASSFSSSASAAAADDSAPASTSTPGAHAQRVRPVSLTLVLPDGRTRLPLRALPGSTLASVLLDHASEIPEQHAALEGEYSHGVSAVGLSPEGRGAADAVVEVPAEVAAAQPRGGGGAERRALEELAEVVRPNSRLASSVVVDERMEGAVIALSRLRPWATL